MTTTHRKMAPVSGSQKKKTRLKVFGVGSAGCNAVELMAQSDFKGVEFVAVNTDLESLLNLSAAFVLPLGAQLTRGLGTGGDVAIGRSAVQEEAEQLRRLCADADVVVIVTGLGGGMGTGATPVLAQVAKETGALVLAIVTLPFDCEGADRQSRAILGLEEIRQAADAVICLPNQRVLKIIDEKTSLLDTFKIANELLAQGLRGIWNLLSRSGILNVDFADLCAVVRGRHGESAFAAAEARGGHRARDVVDRLMSSPLLDGGAVLREAESVLVSLAGGINLRMTEINRVMAKINQVCENARIVMGAVVSEDLEDRLSLTIIATRSRPTEVEMDQVAAVGTAETAPVEENERPIATSQRNSGEAASDLGAQFLQRSPSVRPPSRFVAPPPELTHEKKQQMLAQQHGKSYRKPRKRMHQGMLPLEILSKGRFEKSEPTIHHGEDLDVPTYIRRGVPLN